MSRSVRILEFARDQTDRVSAVVGGIPTAAGTGELIRRGDLPVGPGTQPSNTGVYVLNPPGPVTVMSFPKMPVLIPMSSS